MRRARCATNRGACASTCIRATTDPNTFYLYEVYENQDAHMVAHRAAPHYIKWRETVQGWFDGDPQRVAMTSVFPSDAGWRQQKPHLVKW